MTQSNSPFKVLVVDDDPSVRMLVPNLLRSKGYTTIKAADGEEGVALATEQQPDLILLDINMPRMNGFDACQLLKQQPQTAQIPIVFMTSLGNDSDRLKGFDVGGEDYVVKPINMNELLARIHRFTHHAAQLPLEELIRSLDHCVLLATELADAPEITGKPQETAGDLLEALKSMRATLRQTPHAAETT